MEEMITLELAEIKQQLAETEERLMKQLVPRDSADDRGVVLEVSGITRTRAASLMFDPMHPLHR